MCSRPSKFLICSHTLSAEASIVTCLLTFNTGAAAKLATDIVASAANAIVCIIFISLPSLQGFAQCIVPEPRYGTDDLAPFSHN